MSNANNLISQQSKLGNVATRIGSCLWWALPSCSVERQYLEDMANHYKVLERYLPEKIKFMSAVRRAIADIETPLKKEKILLRERKNDSQERILGIVYEQNLGHSNKANYSQLGIITANKITEKIEVIHEAPSYAIDTKDYKVVEKIKQLVNSTYDRTKLHNEDDVRSVITAFTSECGISLRASGGIYFVPMIHQQMLENISAFVKAVAPSTEVFIKPEYAMHDSDLAALRSITQSSLANELVELEKSFTLLQADIDKMLTSKERPTKHKEKQLVNQLSEYNAMKQRIATFADTLNFTGDKLTDQLASLHKNMEAKLDKLKVSISADLRSNFDTDSQKTSDVPIVPPAPLRKKASKRALSTLASIEAMLADLD